MVADRWEISTERRRLPGRTERRGAQTGLPTVGAFFFGGIFFTVGVLIMLVGMRVIPVDPKGVHAPWWVLTVLGLVFAGAGLFVEGMALRQLRSEQRRRAAAGQVPHEPALADYGWDPTGFAVPRWNAAIQALVGAVFLTLFLSVFNYWAFFTTSPGMVKGIVVLFDLILLAVWWETFRRIGKGFKFGGSRIVFTRFPERLGAPVMVRWQPGEGIVQARRGAFTLRCVTEWFEHRGSGKNRSAHLVQEELWSATAHLDRQRMFTRGETLEWRFEPPPTLPPTQLSAAQPVFWEFEVKLELPGLDFEEVYLVPVYPAAR